jgi:branched-chain amino acid transport system substrate-binding protein
MLTPASTNPDLTHQGFHRVFRTVHHDQLVGREMAQYAQAQGYRIIMICYARNEYGLGLANAFEQEAVKLGLQIPDRQSYEQAAINSQSNFARILDSWKGQPFDAIFVTGAPPQAGHFIAQARQQGITVPIFGGDALDTPQLMDAAGSEAEGVVIASVFHPDNPRPEVQRFVEAFERRYGKKPDSWAARGYEAVSLLAYAIQTGGSAEPSIIAHTLRTMQTWQGITGSFHFDERGDVVGKSIIRIVVRNKEFAFLEDISFAQHPFGVPIH